VAQAQLHAARAPRSLGCQIRLPALAHRRFHKPRNFGRKRHDAEQHINSASRLPMVLPSAATRAMAPAVCRSSLKMSGRRHAVKLQTFAAPDNWTIVGEAEVRKDHLARYYVDGARVAIVRPMGVFTALVCADGAARYVMTSDWSEVEHLEGTGDGGR
jgi:hypothetical protein